VEKPCGKDLTRNAGKGQVVNVLSEALSIPPAQIVTIGEREGSAHEMDAFIPGPEPIGKAI
jgi:hypothetical protein